MDDLLMLILVLMYLFGAVCLATCLMMLVSKELRSDIIADFKRGMK